MSYKKILLSKEYTDVHNDKTICTISTVEFDNLFIEETLDVNYSIKHHGKCKIAVYENEGPVPHFHIFSIDNTFICCIRLDKPEYFSHGKYKGKLSNSDIRKLITVLNTVDEELNMTNFEYACYLWNKHTNTVKSKIKKPYKMPDYTKLND